MFRVCKAIGCNVECPHSFIVCNRHWFMLPTPQRLRLRAVLSWSQRERQKRKGEVAEVIADCQLALAMAEYGRPFTSVSEAARFIRRKGVDLSREVKEPGDGPPGRSP